jgi:NADPH:quinone reductase-like Zn-dependent oxidoreductase
MANRARTNVRNGYRHREFDTRAGTLDVAIPKLRSGSYFPDWLLERRRRAERALTTVVATCYLLGVLTRRMEKLVESLGITRLSKSQVPTMAAELDAQVAAFRGRPLARAVPDGIDTVYENVGAALLPALVPHLNRNAQIAVGGVMSQITQTGSFEGPDNLPDLLRAALYKTLTIRGFDVTEFYDRYPEFLADLAPAVAEHKLHYSTQIVDGGIEVIPAVFPEMFTGRGAGKMIAKAG